MRNRIMAGLSHAVLIIEGEEDSGTLITARLALEYNRDVLAVPGSIFSPSSRGPLNLIKKGAIPICSADDLLEALDLQNPLNLQDETKQEEQYSRCSPEEHEVLEALSEPQSREELLSKINFDVSKLQVVLSMLELRGLITEECGYISRRFVKNR
jgi:DNA processing protein